MHDSAQQQQGQPVLRIDAKLTNADGEFLASGPCEVHFDRGEVTMWPSWEMHMLERQQGVLRLELDNGRTLAISERHLTFKLSGPAEQRITVYRLRLRELESRIDGNPLVLNEGNFFDKWGRRLKVEEVDLQ